MTRRLLTMMTRRLLTTLLALALALSGAARAQASPRDDGESKLTPEEEQEARAVVVRFVRRFAETKDIGPLMDEFFVADYGERLRHETSEDAFMRMFFSETRTLEQANPDDLRRYYVAAINCLYMSSVYQGAAKYLKNKDRREEDDEVEPTLKEALPADARAALSRDPLFSMLYEDSSGGGSDADDERKAGLRAEARRTLVDNIARLREVTDALEAATAVMRAGLGVFPSWLPAQMLGQDLPAGGQGDDISFEITTLEDSFRGEAKESKIVCATTRMFHIDLVKVGDRFRILNLASEDYKPQTAEEKKRDARLRAFLRAIEEGDRETFDEMLQSGINVNAKGDDTTPLIAAAMSHRPDMLKALIARGANVNAKNSFGNSVLIYAINGENRFEMTRALLEAGADVNIENGDGQTALHDVLRYDNEWSKRMARLLRKYGAR